MRRSDVYKECSSSAICEHSREKMVQKNAGRRYMSMAQLVYGVQCYNVGMAGRGSLECSVGMLWAPQAEAQCKRCSGSAM
jgi:hypothetical protein